MILLCCGMGLNLSMGQSRTTLTAANSDCGGIIDLLPADSVFGPTTAPIGQGTNLEISGEKDGLYAFEKEHNTVWYRFRVPFDGILTFDVIPLSVKDDYDFLLYKFTGKNFCAEVYKQLTKPVRSCLSRNDPALGSRTGLKSGAEDEFVHAGPGASYCKPLTVKKGEVYVLVLDNVYAGGKGHTLKLHYSKAAAVVAQQLVKPTGDKRPPVDLSVKIIDRKSRLPVKANIKIQIKKNSGTPVKLLDSVSTISVGLECLTSYVISTEAINYFGCVKEVSTTSSPGNMSVVIEMDRIAAGVNVIFEDILFAGNEARFLSESTPSLEALLNTMKQNPRLVIVIQGHVNCPVDWESCKGQKMQDFNMNLSLARAKAVRDYLVGEGIDESRMSYQGYGANRMLYPDAKSEDKMKRNRRVEIVIVSN